MLYFDDTQLPLGQKGLDIVMHFYNASINWNGKNQAVVEAKKLTPEQRNPSAVPLSEGACALKVTLE